jgi:hypothetical protein
VIWVDESHPRRRKAAAVGIVALALCMAFALAFGGTADAKKKKKHKSASVFAASVTPNAAIPDEVANGPSIPITSTISVGKKFKGKTVGDVNVTGIQTTGNATDAADDVGLRLTAPDGTNVLLINPTGIGDVSIGPLTFDDDTSVSICDAITPPCDFPGQTLNRPFAGTANLLFMGSGGSGPLSAFNGSAMRGTWTMTAWDEADIGKTNVLNTWGVQITAARPAV